ncbi:MAG TPA: hypothetical protein P5308_01405 [Syntrophales bacterium]|nr:hypothetical protein [Syntrophobacterales bacterium]HRT69992.1 hypothetical protein [Syntrophales bacterium]
MKKLAVIVVIVVFASNAFALDLSQMKPVVIKKSARQQELEKKYAEMKPSMPGKTPYEVCMAALAKLPPLGIPRSHPDYAKSEASCSMYEGSPELKAAAYRKAGEKTDAQRKVNATFVGKTK